jgi:hypothetical protein
MTNVEKAESIGILDDLRENYSDDQINAMSPRSILDAWLSWEGFIGYTNGIMQIVNLFFEPKK